METFYLIGMVLSGLFFGTGAIKSKMLAGFIGGIVMAIGALTWGGLCWS